MAPRIKIDSVVILDLGQKWALYPTLLYSAERGRYWWALVSIVRMFNYRDLSCRSKSKLPNSNWLVIRILLPTSGAGEGADYWLMWEAQFTRNVERRNGNELLGSSVAHWVITWSKKELNGALSDHIPILFRFLSPLSSGEISQNFAIIYSKICFVHLKGSPTSTWCGPAPPTVTGKGEHWDQSDHKECLIWSLSKSKQNIIE